jgi:centrosomal protein CEP104
MVKVTEKWDSIDHNVVNNPLSWNDGDDDLEPYLKPLLSAAGGKSHEVGAEVLHRLQNLGLLNVFGARAWSCMYSSNWKIREAAAQAILNFISMPVNKKYVIKSKRLFMACIELCRISSEDKLLQIYYIGLSIFAVAIKPPVCGEDISPTDINKILAEFAPIIIKKISELNYRARDISMHTIISLYRHPAAHLQSLLDACMDLCEKQRDYVLYGKAKMPPIEKQAPRLVLSRLELVLQVLQEFGYDDNYEWRDICHF